MQTASNSSSYYAYISSNYNYTQSFSIKAKGGGNEYTIMDWGDGQGLEFHGGSTQNIKFSNHDLKSIDTITCGAISTSANLDMNANSIIDIEQLNGTGGTGWLDFNMDADNVYPQASTDNQTVLGSITHMNFVGDSNGNGTGGIFYWGYGVDQADNGTFTQTMSLDRSAVLKIGLQNTNSGSIDLYGGSSGAEGGEIRLHTTNSYDTTYEWYRIDAYADDFRIGRQGQTDLTIDQTGKANFGGLVSCDDGFQINGTTVIDSSRNLTNIGTISSSGNLTLTQSSGNNTLYLNSSGGGNPVIYMEDSTRKWGQFVASGTFYLKNETANIETVKLNNDGTISIIGNTSITGNTSTTGTFTSGLITTSAGMVVTDTTTNGRGIYRNNRAYDLRLGGGTDRTTGAYISISGDQRGGTNSAYNGRIEFHTGGVNAADASSVLGDFHWYASHNSGSTHLLSLDSVTGDLDLKLGGLEINGTEVISSARSLTNIGSITCGGIHTSAGLTFGQGDHFLGDEGGQNDSEVLVLRTGASASSAALKLIAGYGQGGDTSGKIQLYTNGSTTSPKLEIDIDGNIKMGATTVINNSRNFTANSRITFSANSHYFETGTNALSFKNSSGVVRATFNASGISTPGSLTLSSHSAAAVKMNFDQLGDLSIIDQSSSKLRFGMTDAEDIGVQLMGFGGNISMELSDGVIYGFGTQNSDSDFKFLDNGTAHFRNDVIAFSSTISSDRKLKENIQPIEGGLNKVLKLKGVSFDWKDQEKGTNQLGFIAQEVEKVLPELVKEVETLGTEDGTHKVVNYDGVIPVLVEAIKMQQKQIDRLSKLLEKK